jgi:hypothetical protein
MLELKTELTDGFARIPTGLGSSVAITNGLVRGNSWAAAILYGMPALLFANTFDLVSIGRTITFLLSLVLGVLMYRMMRAFHVSSLLALFALLLLVTSRSFFFASHAARLDVAAAVSVLGFTWYLSSRFDRWHRAVWLPTPTWFFLYGIAAILFATVSIHLLTLFGLLSVYMLFRFGAVRKPKYVLFASAGALSALVALIAIYKISGAPFTVFGHTAIPNQFQGVVQKLPIERPFSRSVQVANILERITGLWSEATFIVVILAVSVLLLFLRRSSKKNSREIFLFGGTAVILIAWLFFESPARYYFIQVLPLFIVAATIAIYSRQIVNKVLPIAICSLALLYFGMRDARNAQELSETIHRDNSTAIEAALHTIRTESRSSRPIVLAQNPAIASLEREPDIRLMTAHFVSFPLSSEPIANVLRTIPVNYIVLYAAGDGSVYSDDYHALRPIADSVGTVLLKQTGILFDVHRDYFTNVATRPNDTLILYKLVDSLAR